MATGHHLEDVIATCHPLGVSRHVAGNSSNTQCAFRQLREKYGADFTGATSAVCSWPLAFQTHPGILSCSVPSLLNPSASVKQSTELQSALDFFATRQLNGALTLPSLPHVQRPMGCSLSSHHAGMSAPEHHVQMSIPTHHACMSAGGWSQFITADCPTGFPPEMSVHGSRIPAPSSFVTAASCGTSSGETRTCIKFWLAVARISSCGSW